MRSGGLPCIVVPALRIAFVAAVCSWGWAVSFAADQPANIDTGAPNSSSGLPVPNPSRELTPLEDEDLDVVPINRLVPRIKTVQPSPVRLRRWRPDARSEQGNVGVEQVGNPKGDLDDLSDAPDGDGLESTSQLEFARDDDPEFLPDPQNEAATVPNCRPRKQVQRSPARGIPTVAVVAPGASGAGLAPPEAETELTPQPEQPGLTIEPWMLDPGEYGDLSCPPQGVDDCHCWGPFRKFLYFNQTNGDIGIGQERVMFAPFEIETSQPANNFRLKAMSAFNLQNPDRGEYIWAKIGGPGPSLPESNVNYQNYDAIYEAGGNRFSLVTDIPMRFVDPEINPSGSGLGNISIAPKTVLVNGNDWQITTIFRTYLPTGATQRGSSNGLVSLEPGVLIRYRWSPRTFLHSQVKYWIPLTGDPTASGNVFNYGLGISTVLFETDAFAIIPVLEAVGWTVGGGTATLASGTIASANTSFVNIQPGCRFVLGPKGDLGLCEFGISGGFATTSTGWYREQFTVEVRWSW
jgi:hypothetical protein